MSQSNNKQFVQRKRIPYSTHPQREESILKPLDHALSVAFKNIKPIRRKNKLDNRIE